MLNAQDNGYTNSAIKTKIEGLKQMGEVFHPVELLSFNRLSHLDNIGDYFVYEINKSKLTEVFQADYNSMNFIIPQSNGKTLELYLTRNEIFTDGFFESTTDGEGTRKTENSNGKLYHGIINQDGKNSLACISVFENEIAGVICDETGNWNIGKLIGAGKNDYAYFNDRSFRIPSFFSCGTSERDVRSERNGNNELESVTPIKKCVRIFIDCDKSLYNYLGSSSAAKTYIQNIFNVSSTIYGNEDVSISISSIHYWTSTSVDHFSGTNSSNALNDFESWYSSHPFNGDVAHLLAHDGDNGGRANISAICNGFGYSDIKANYSAGSFVFTTYTWDVQCFTHELGHNFGSNHTHWCGWPGGAIDNCNTYWGSKIQNGPITNSCSGSFAYPLGTEGGCSNGPSPGSNGGTIMSYCHGCSNIGIKFINGFGSKPGGAIRSFIAGKSCLTNCSNSCKPYLSVGVPITTGNSLTFKAQYITFGSNDIASGATANFTGGSLVILNPGFHAYNGSAFHGYIASCTTPLTRNDYNLSSREFCNSSKGNISIIPNPFTQTFTISFKNSPLPKTQIQIFNLMGQLLKTVQVNSFKGDSNIKIDMSECKPGVYFANVITGSEKFVQKLIKL